MASNYQPNSSPLLIARSERHAVSLSPPTGLAKPIAF